MIEKLKTIIVILIKVIWHKLIPYKIKLLINKSPHGDMINNIYANNIFKKHVKFNNPNPNGTILEIGPGDSPNSCIDAIKYGFNNAILIDNAKYFDIKDYEECYKLKYLTNGINAFESIQDNEIDFCFSHTVLQHINLDQIENFIKNIYRVMKKGSTGSHHIDFKDMLFGQLNHLFIESSIWESSLIKGCPFYTNRLRKSEIISIFKKNGFSIEILNEKKINPNIDRNNLIKKFSSITEDDLLCSSIQILTKKK